MKKYLLLSALGLSLMGCQKPNDGDVAPAEIEAGFDSDFNLGYQQQAKLISKGQLELSVALTDLDYTFCPENVTCAVGTFVAPTLSVTDARGLTQQIRMPLHQVRAYNETWIDTASLRANDRRYLLYYRRYRIATGAAYPQKKDISIVLRVTKP